MEFNLPNKKYKVIYADPPWHFNSKKAGGNMSSGALANYPVLTVEQMKRMDVTGMAQDDCLLVMWYVSSQPKEAIELAESWGFKVKHMNGFIWNKLTVNLNPFFGMGFYTRAGAESALIAVKGKPSNLIADHGVRQIHNAVNKKHSQKPQVFRDSIVKMCGDVPRIELFARNKTEGWDVWGNEV